MKRLGISVYPLVQNEGEMKDYILKAKKYGFSRLFSSLLEVDESNKDEIVEKMSNILNFAKEQGFDTILDVSSSVLSVIGVSLPNVEKIESMGVTTLRLDLPSNGRREKQVVENSSLNIEWNLSGPKSWAGIIEDLAISKNRVTTSHNFFPQKYTGISYDLFIENTREFKNKGFVTAAWITSQSPNAKYGPWAINDGLPTLEEHRNMPIHIQAKHYWATGLIDDVIISNSFASEEELKKLSELSRDKIELTIETNNISDLESEILFENNTHYNRGDCSDYLIRTTSSRIKYISEDIPPKSNEQEQEAGNIYINNNLFNEYKGEVQIIKKNLEIDNRKNLVGRIVEEEMFLLRYIKANTPFCLKNKE